MKKTLALLLAAALCLSLGACAAPSDPSAVPNQSMEEETPSSQEVDLEPVTITTYDAAGNPVETTYDTVPQRVVAVYQGCIETMIALGLEDHVIASYGLDNEVKEEWQDGLAKMNYQTEPFAPDKETAALLQPDLIFSWGSLFGEKMLGDVPGWMEKGANTYINTNTRPGGSRTLENEYTDLLNIGKIFRVEDRAQALVDEMKAEIQSTLDAVAGKEPVRVAVIEPISNSITNYGANSLAGDMVTALGGELAIPDAGKIGKEDLLAADPEVIFVVYMAYRGDDPESVRQSQLAVLTEDPGLRSLSAVQNDRLPLIMLGDMYASGPRTLDGIRAFAAGMYPEN